MEMCYIHMFLTLCLLSSFLPLRAEPLQPGEAEPPRPRPEGRGRGGEPGAGDGAPVSDGRGGPAAGRRQAHAGAAEERRHQGQRGEPTLMNKHKPRHVDSESGPQRSSLNVELIPRQIWMLTGDKLETATCIAKSSHLVSRTQDIHVFKPVRSLCFPPALRWDHKAPTRREKGAGLKPERSSRLVSCGSRADLEQRRGPSGAQRLQKETWLCSGHLRRLLRGTAAAHSDMSSQTMLRAQLMHNERGNKKHFTSQK